MVHYLVPIYKRLLKMRVKVEGPRLIGFLARRVPKVTSWRQSNSTEFNCIKKLELTRIHDFCLGNTQIPAFSLARKPIPVTGAP